MRCFIPVHLGQHDIHQYQINIRILIQTFEGFFPILSYQYLHPLFLKSTGDRKHIAHVIIHQQYFFIFKYQFFIVDHPEYLSFFFRKIRFNTMQEQSGLIKEPFRGVLPFNNDAFRMLIENCLFLPGKVPAGINDNRRVKGIIIVSDPGEEFLPRHIGKTQIQDYTVKCF